MGGLLKDITRALVMGVVFTLSVFATAGAIAVTVSGFDTGNIQSGAVVSAADIKGKFDALNAAINGIPDCTPYFAAAGMSADQTVADGTDALLNLDVETVDGANMFSSSAPGRLTIPATGTYMVFTHITWRANTGARVTVSPTAGTMQ